MKCTYTALNTLHEPAEDVVFLQDLNHVVEKISQHAPSLHSPITTWNNKGELGDVQPDRLQPSSLKTETVASVDCGDDDDIDDSDEKEDVELVLLVLVPVQADGGGSGDDGAGGVGQSIAFRLLHGNIAFRRHDHLDC